MRGLGYEIATRGNDHDNSKFSEDELPGFVELFEAEPTTEVQSEQYEQVIKNADCIQTHYRNNRHHPEHHDYVEKMSLLDLIEMVCDWKAAAKSYRHKGLRENLAYLKKAKGLTLLQCYIVDLIVEWIDPKDECEHEWVDATNKVVSGAEICLKCKTIRAMRESC